MWFEPITHVPVFVSSDLLSVDHEGRLFVLSNMIFEDVAQLHGLQ